MVTARTSPAGRTAIGPSKRSMERVSFSVQSRGSAGAIGQPKPECTRSACPASASARPPSHDADPRCRWPCGGRSRPSPTQGVAAGDRRVRTCRARPPRAVVREGLPGNPGHRGVPPPPCRFRDLRSRLAGWSRSRSLESVRAAIGRGRGLPGRMGVALGWGFSRCDLPPSSSRAPRSATNPPDLTAPRRAEETTRAASGCSRRCFGRPHDEARFRQAKRFGEYGQWVPWVDNFPGRPATGCFTASTGVLADVSASPLDLVRRFNQSSSD